MTTYPVPVAEMRERYLKLYSGAVNDILRFDYRMHAALPSEFAPLDRSMKLAGQAFTIKGAPDITTDGEFEMRAQMLEALPEDSIVVWDCTGDRITAQWGEVMTMAAMRAGCRGARRSFSTPSRRSHSVSACAGARASSGCRVSANR